MTKQSIYLLVGVPGVGKTWVCNQIAHKFEYVHHDGFIYLKQPGAYLNAILEKAPSATKPLLIEAPFSISETKDPLEKAGYKVIPIFIIEHETILMDRYQKREKKPIPPGHLTRMKTYLSRAKDWGSFHGTSRQVMEYLKTV